MIANYVLLNLILTLLLATFEAQVTGEDVDEANDDAETGVKGVEEEGEGEADGESRGEANGGTPLRHLHFHYGDGEVPADGEAPAAEVPKDATERNRREKVELMHRFGIISHFSSPTAGEAEQARAAGYRPNGSVLSDAESDEESDDGSPVARRSYARRSFTWVSNARLRGYLEHIDEYLERSYKEDKALGLLEAANPFRVLATALVKLECRMCSDGGHLVSFDSFILVVIVVSSAALAFESCTLQADSQLAAVLATIDSVSTYIFITEMLLKISSLGLAFTPTGYLRSGWNQLDAFVILVIVLSQASPAVRALRMLRVLRPLRLISKVEGLRVAVQLLLKSLPRVQDVLLIFLLILLIFAILGVQLLGGTLASCADLPHLTSKQACAAAGGAWVNPEWGSFDNVFAAALVLFEVSAVEGWTSVLWASMDAVGVDVAPERDHAPARGLFIVSWLLLGALLLLNAIAGVVVATFAEIKAHADGGGALLTERQRNWVDMMSHMLTLRPRRRIPCPREPWRAACYRIATHGSFEGGVLGVIMLNTLMMALDGYHISPIESWLISLVNTICSLIFVAEAGVKLIGLGIEPYFSCAAAPPKPPHPQRPSSPKPLLSPKHPLPQSPREAHRPPLAPRP